ncbi:helix-turn-helix domain-containing protein [Lentzea chajnantorensis]
MPRIRAATIEEHHEMVWADLAEAVRQLLLERDYDSINMGHIAARAGLARNTLYNYARDKRALVLALAHRASLPLAGQVAEIAARSSDPAADRLRGGRRDDPGRVHAARAAADVPAELQPAGGGAAGRTGEPVLRARGRGGEHRRGGRGRR